MGDLKKTVLFEQHKKLGAKIVEFAGWLMPVQYSNVIDEHTTTRKNAGLFDVSHMGEIKIQGVDAQDLIYKLITNDATKLEKNKAFYACMCNDNGGVIDDLFVYCFDDENYMLVVNASTKDKDLEWIKKQAIGFDVEVKDITDETAKIDIQGPNAEKILQKLTKASLITVQRFGFIEDSVCDVDAIISRTGYTGEDGFELYFDSNQAEKIWAKLLEQGKELGIKPAGLGARDTLRIESCYSLYGHELTEEITPLEAGIGFVVKLDKDDFIGKDALVSQKENLKRKIAAFELIDKAIPREHYKVLKNGKEIGFVTSGTFSPSFRKGIGLAMINVEEGKEGNEIEIEIREKMYKAKIVKKPFYKYKGGK